MKYTVLLLIAALFISCTSETKETSIDLSAYAEKGKQAALATKKVLGKNLMQAMAEQGTAEAIEFCNVKATSLIDSMQTKGIRIKRVSDKNRNPNNTTNENELAYIEKVKQALASDQEVKPYVFNDGDHVTGYYPIVSNGMCLQCHGVKGQDITLEVATKLDSLYPEDKATGYDINQLRGIWVVEMKK